MIAFDTNYLVRHIVQDDAKQCGVVAKALCEQTALETPIMLFDLVLMETYWVLGSCYGFDRKAWVAVLDQLLHDSAFRFEDPNRLRSAAARFGSGRADFADYLIYELARKNACKLKTFDKTLRKEFGY